MPTPPSFFGFQEPLLTPSDQRVLSTFGDVAQKNDVSAQTYLDSRWRPTSRARTPSLADAMLAGNRSRGYASPNRYMLLILPNDYVRQNTGMRFVEDISRLAVTCKSVATIDRSWFTAEENFVNAGPSRYMPYRANNANTAGIKLTFNCGGDMFEKEFFDSWMGLIQNPISKNFTFYDTYAKGSTMVMLLFPNTFTQFTEVIEASQRGLLSGYAFTEIYPYSIGLNGGNLSTAAATEPMTVEVGLMFREMVPLSPSPTSMTREMRQSEIVSVTKRGDPTDDAQMRAMTIADAGFNSRTREMQARFAIDSESMRADIVRANESRLRFLEQQDALRAQANRYLTSTQSYFMENSTPRAQDGLVGNPVPSLPDWFNKALTIGQQIQGFFGVGYFGNGWYPFK